MYHYMEELQRSSSSGLMCVISLFPLHLSLYFFEIKLIINFVSSPQNETQDFLFIATERYKFCVLPWDAEKSELLTRFEHFTDMALAARRT
jgi:hypothetical protein